MLAEKVCNLGLYRLGEQGARTMAQDFSELIVDVSWLNQLDDVIFGHGISLLRWRSGGVKHPHDMPPSRFPPSPTFSDSSIEHRPRRCLPRQTFVPKAFPVLTKCLLSFFLVGDGLLGLLRSERLSLSD